MLEVIQKHEYFEWCDAGLVNFGRRDIKAAQDAWILSVLSGTTGLKIAEVGGGDSRVLAKLKSGNECWNVDKLNGRHGGPDAGAIVIHQEVKYVKTYLGEFSKDIPDSYFDFVFSISVVEHLVNSQIEQFFLDVARILKPGGRSLHAIDYYVGDVPRPEVDDNIRKIITQSEGNTGMRFDFVPVCPRPLLFRSSYVTNSDMAMHDWNMQAPNLRHVRENCQAITLKSAWHKPK